MGKFLLDASIVLSVLVSGAAVFRGLWRISRQLHEMHTLILAVPELTIAIRELKGRMDKIEAARHG